MLRELAPLFDAFLVDVWGVIHDGERPFEHVIPALEALAAAGRRVVFLTNTSRLGPAVAETLEQMGIARTLFDDVVTAGDVTRDALVTHEPALFATLPPAPRTYQFGAAAFVPWLFELDLHFTDDVAAADLIVATGAVADEAALAEARAHLEPAALRDVPLVCTNPDRVIPTPAGLKLGPGAIAQAYAALGGRTFLYGKPHAAIYVEALRRLAAIDPRRVLALGDMIDTDVRGARDAGLASALVTGTGLRQTAGDLAPDYVLDRLAW